MKAIEVDQEKGIYLFDWCKICKDDLIHHVVPIEYRMFHVHYYFICIRCLNKHTDRQDAGAEYPSLGIKQEKIFYKEGEKDTEIWNEWVTYGGLE